MATIDLGKIKLVWRGTYAGGTDYTVDDVVQHTDGGITSSFICTTNSTGNAPSTGGSVHGSWAYLAKGSGDATLTTQGDILYRDASGNQRLPKGTAGQSLIMNAGATAPEWGTGFSGNYVLHAHDRYVYDTTVTVSSVSNGNADGNKDCIVINGGAYNSGSNGCTFTPAHVDDLFFISGGINYYSSSNNGYAGLGVQTSTSTDFSANRNFPYYNGQHSQGNGSGQGDEYRRLELSFVMSASQLNLSAGTQYYFRLVGQKHDGSNQAKYNEATNTVTHGKHQMTMVHWKKA